MGGSTLSGFIGSLTAIVQSVIVFLGLLALLAFFWGIAKYIHALSSGSEDGIKAGRSTILWGIIALFVLTTVYGIIVFVRDDLGLTNNAPKTSHSIIPLLPE